MTILPGCLGLSEFISVLSAYMIIQSVTIITLNTFFLRYYKNCKEGKWSLFTEDMIIYLENLRKCIETITNRRSH